VWPGNLTRSGVTFAGVRLEPPHPRWAFHTAVWLGGPGLLLGAATSEKSLVLLLPGGLLLMWLAAGFLFSRDVWLRFKDWIQNMSVGESILIGFRAWPRGKAEYFAPERIFGGLIALLVGAGWAGAGVLGLAKLL